MYLHRRSGSARAPVPPLSRQRPELAPPPNDKAEFYSIVPDKCPRCEGVLKDYNAQTVVIAPGVSMVPNPGLLAHLFICQWCRLKLFAPKKS
jgi:hypothetical protein